MPRPMKCRRVCAPPGCTRFGPAPGSGREVRMTLDEYESIRLIDLEGMSQEACAAQMEVARTTAQAIYQSARKKLAQCIVQGCQLEISGGEVQLCGVDRERCPRCCGRGCTARGEPRKEGTGK